MHITSSRIFRNFILRKYPSIVGNEPFIRFFHYLCFGNFFDKDTRQLVIPTTTIAEKFYRRPYEHRFNGKAVLEEFRDVVLPGLEWTTHERETLNSYLGKARRISNLGLDAEMQEALRAECLNPPEDRVDFVTGQSYSRKDRYQETAEEAAEYERELAQSPLNATQRKIVDSLRNISAGHLFLRKLGQNTDAVQAAIETLSPELQSIRYRILASIQCNPHLYYLPSQRERTCRLSPRGDTILGLKSTVRKALCAGWVECDLRSSQFAILAAKLEAPLSQGFIDSGESIWRSFYRHSHGLDQDPPQEIKKVFKEAIYSLCFGKSATNLIQLLNDHRVVQLLSHPILQELLKLRKAWFQRIREEGGAFDVWGQWQALDLSKNPTTKKTFRWEGAVAASVIQSVEMEIIAPIFDVAEKHGKSDQFTIALFQHDGGTISFNAKDKILRAQTKLKAAVENRAKALGVSTVL